LTAANAKGAPVMTGRDLAIYQAADAFELFTGGVAGAGLIGRKHIELIEASPNCVVAGIADPWAEAKAFAATNHFPWYPDLRELLERERPDGTIVASPNAMHPTMALDCIERGVPALIEKPVTDTAVAAQRLHQAVQRSGVLCLSATIAAIIR